jgi:HSP20 family molecular chaperone IbpA
MVMGSRKLDLHSSFNNTDLAVDRIFAAAFGPSLALYRQVSLCGWRPLGSFTRGNFAIHGSGPSEASEHRPEPSSGIEIYETRDAMTIEVALTGVKEESLHLSIAGKTVIIRGERIISAPQENKGIYPLGRQTRFQHLIALPENVKTGGFRAQLKGDVVQIDFAKRRTP